MGPGAQLGNQAVPAHGCWPRPDEAGAGAGAGAGGDGSHRVAALLLGAAACSLRPPIALLWAALGLHHLGTAAASDRTRFLCEAIGCVSLVFGVSALIDRCCFGEWTFPPWNFVVWNAVTGGAARYGTHPWHWYITQGLPTVLGPGIAPAALLGIGVVLSQPAGAGGGNAVLLWVVLWVVAVYSTQPHKEFRFVLLTLPLFAVYAGRGLAFLDASSSASAVAAASEGKRRRKPNRSRSPSPSKGGGKKSGGTLPGALGRARATVPHWLLLAAMVLLNAPLAYYFGRWHQAGPVSAIWHLADEADQLVAAGGDSSAMSVLFLMPCHSTPWHASLHPHRMQLRQLDCSPPPPPPPGEREAPHETDRFYADPEGVAGGLLDEDRTGITHVAMFSDMAARLQPLLERRGFGYGEEAESAARRFFHAHIIDDDRASAELVVVRRGGG